MTGGIVGAAMSRRPLCSAAHTAVLIDVDKGIRPCCAYEGQELPGSPSMTVLGDRSLDRILSEPPWTTVRDQLARGEVPPGCVACIEREKLGGWSQRVVMESRRSPNWERGITYLELSSSNLCNLQCRHCSPLFSSRWSAHETRHGRRGAPVVHPDGELLLRNLRSVDLSHLDYVVVKGGEPMLNSDFALLLDHLDQIGVFANVTVDMVTNGTVIDPRILEKLSRVRSLRVCFSIDGVGDVQTYIRHGSSSIERIEKSIAVYAAMPNVELTRSTSVMVYNVFHLDRIDAWWDGLASRFPGKYLRPGYGLFVLSPEALAISSLQDHTRAALQARYAAIDAKRYAPVIRMLEQPFAGVRRHDGFVRWTRRVDAELGRQVLDAVPELADEMQWLDENSVEVVEQRAQLRREQEREERLVRESQQAAVHLAIQRGWEAVQHGQIAAASELALQVPSLESIDAGDRAAVLHLRSAVAGLGGALAESLALIESAILAVPENLALRLHRARVLEALGRHDAAIVDALVARGDTTLRSIADELVGRCRSRLG